MRVCADMKQIRAIIQVDACTQTQGRPGVNATAKPAKCSVCVQVWPTVKSGRKTIISVLLLIGWIDHVWPVAFNCLQLPSTTRRDKNILSVSLNPNSNIPVLVQKVLLLSIRFVRPRIFFQAVSHRTKARQSTFHSSTDFARLPR